jgi:uncharacterized protein with PIN domain
MGIFTLRNYCVECDRCGEEFGSAIFHDTRENLIESIEEEGWRVNLDENKYLCPKCKEELEKGAGK